MKQRQGHIEKVKKRNERDRGKDRNREIRGEEREI